MIGISRTAYSHCRLETANEQVVSPAYGALDGDCDYMVCVLKLITNLVKKATSLACKSRA